MSDENRSRGPLAIGAFLVAAVAVGVVAGLAVTSALGGLRPPTRASASATPAAISSGIALPSVSPEPTASPTRSPAATESPSAEPSPSVEVALGCFAKGAQLPERKPKPPVVAQGLQDRLPYLGYFSEPVAYVGSSISDGLGLGYVNGFIACTGADPDHIRYGAVSVGSTLGVIPMAAQVDGWTGPELAHVLLYGYVPADQLDELRPARHDGWTYWWSDWKIGIAASPDTVYWFQPFCCVEVGPDDEDLPTFKEIIEEYLELINDRPAR